VNRVKAELQFKKPVLPLDTTEVKFIPDETLQSRPTSSSHSHTLMNLRKNECMLSHASSTLHDTERTRKIDFKDSNISFGAGNSSSILKSTPINNKNDCWKEQLKKSPHLKSSNIQNRLLVNAYSIII
jgi:hypothetical protein